MPKFLLKIRKISKIIVRRVNLYNGLFQVALSFYVFDWDGTNIIEDDFLGSAFCTVSEVFNIY